MDLGKLKAQVEGIDPVIRIGKSGLTDGTYAEIKKQLKAKKLIKIRLLKNFISGKDKNEIIQGIVDETKSQLVSKKGFVFSIYRR